MGTEGRSRTPIPPDAAARVNNALKVLRTAGTADADKDAAKEEIAAFLHSHLFPLARWRVSSANGLSASDLFQTAFVNLLGLLGVSDEPTSSADPPRDNIADAERLRIVFCHLLYYRYIDELRQRTRRPGDRGVGQADTPGAEPAAPPDEADRRLRVARRLIALQEALVWLDRHHPRLGAAFKARLLANHEVRFSRAGRSFSRFAREQVRDQERTYAEMGVLLGCSLSEARKRYLEAIEEIRREFPDLLDGRKWGH